MVTEVEPPRATDHIFVCGVGWRAKLTKKNVGTRDEFVACILDAAARIKKCEDQLRRTTRGFRTRVAKCIVAGGGIFEYFFFSSHKFVKYV